LTLKDSGEAAGLSAIAVSVAVKRSGAKMERKLALKTALQQCRQNLKITNVEC
jgi:hypothetical protein